ncbi:MAG TPA: hypothetical protein VGG75_17020 [Trebonia sp.]|jgi:hypothetical protein
MTPLVIHTYGYFSARENPDGSLSHSGPKRGEGYQYIAPDGTRYQRNWTYQQDGSPTGITGHAVTGLVADGKQDVVLTVINRVRRIYGEERTEYPVTGGADAPGPSALDLESSPCEVRQALQDGRATRKGTTMVNGVPAIAFSVPAPFSQRFRLTLHVDARTYQPLRAVTVVDGHPGPRVADWLPATPENIAKATDDESIPADYTKVDDLSQALTPASHPG